MLVALCLFIPLPIGHFLILVPHAMLVGASPPITHIGIPLPWNPFSLTACSVSKIPLNNKCYFSKYFSRYSSKVHYHLTKMTFYI